MTIFFPLLILACSACLLLGAFLLFRPALAIELQRRFYELINWRMEPISMPMELRNTKLMGLSLIVMAAAALIYSLFFSRL